MLDLDVRHILHALPREAVEMSQTGVAYGYDILRYGKKWDAEGSDLSPVIKANTTGVERLFKTESERDWIARAEGDVNRRRARVRALESSMWAAWHEVTPINHNFLLSLIWIPEEMYTPLEILARMGDC